MKTEDIVTFYCQRYEQGDDNHCELLAKTQCDRCKKLIVEIPQVKLLDNIWKKISNSIRRNS